MRHINSSRIFGLGPCLCSYAPVFALFEFRSLYKSSTLLNRLLFFSDITVQLGKCEIYANMIPNYMFFDVGV
jgi:hypothetical protein